MVHWIYVLECKDSHIYIGETTRLYRRFIEHQRGGGAANTSMHQPEALIGLYKVGDNDSFMQYRNNILNNQYDKTIIEQWGEDDSQNLLIENHITEIFLYQRSVMEDDDFCYSDGAWHKIRGGKYTKNLYTNPTASMDAQYIIDRPNCDCQLPSEVKISRDKKIIYFVCSLKNVWDDFYKGLSISEPCDFYKVYSDDTMVKAEHNVASKKISEEWCRMIPFTSSHYPDPCIKCNTSDYIPFFSWYKNRRVCKSCIISKYDELKKEYSLNEYSFVD